MLEVLRALAMAHGMTWEDIELQARRKRAERGGFDRRIFLEHVDQVSRPPLPRNAASKGATVSPGWIYINPPDPEGRTRISAAVTGELPGQALSVVFAVRPDDEVPAVRADPPSLGGKIPGQRYHIAV